jgi:hypothetical protein
MHSAKSRSPESIWREALEMFAVADHEHPNLMLAEVRSMPIDDQETPEGILVDLMRLDPKKAVSRLDEIAPELDLNNLSKHQPIEVARALLRLLFPE